MPVSATVRVGRTGSGYRIRVEGHGTMRESPAVHEFARQVLDGEPGALVMDLSACTYLDSTFLGNLVDLRRRYDLGHPPRFLLVAPPEVRKRLLAPNHLDSLFPFTERCPEVIGEDVELSPVTLGRDDLGLHVLETHRRLAEVEGPNQAAFREVVDRLSRELAAR